jgi:hypothetical protein
MKWLAFVFAFIAFAAHAELYRWVDRESGSVKFSNVPPPWFGDPARELNAPAVEVIRSNSAAPGKPAAPSALAALEMHWRALLQFFSTVPSKVDFERTGAAFQQHIEMYKAVSAELDRQDPAGAARRRAMAQEAGVLDRLRSGLEAQLSTKPPALK